MRRRISRLLVRLARVQSRIDSEHRSRRPNWIALLRLKILRLRIKDRLLFVMKTA